MAATAARWSEEVVDGIVDEVMGYSMGSTRVVKCALVGGSDVFFAIPTDIRVRGDIVLFDASAEAAGRARADMAALVGAWGGDDDEAAGQGSDDDGGDGGGGDGNGDGGDGDECGVVAVGLGCGLDAVSGAVAAMAAEEEAGGDAMLGAFELVVVMVGDSDGGGDDAEWAGLAALVDALAMGGGIGGVLLVAHAAHADAVAAALGRSFTPLAIPGVDAQCSVCADYAAATLAPLQSE